LRGRGAAASEHDQRSAAGNDTAAGDGLFHCVLLQYSDFSMRFGAGFFALAEERSIGKNQII
jgi:hypothetical protein